MGTLFLEGDLVGEDGRDFAVARLLAFTGVAKTSGAGGDGEEATGDGGGAGEARRRFLGEGVLSAEESRVLSSSTNGFSFLLPEERVPRVSLVFVGDAEDVEGTGCLSALVGLGILDFEGDACLGFGVRVGSKFAKIARFTGEGAGEDKKSISSSEPSSSSDRLGSPSGSSTSSRSALLSCSLLVFLATPTCVRVALGVRAAVAEYVRFTGVDVGKIPALRVVRFPGDADGFRLGGIRDDC